MAKNLNFHFDNDGIPRARGKHSERLLMNFLESDVQSSDYICHDIMNDLTAVEDGSAESREFIGNAHSVIISPDGVVINNNVDDIDTGKEKDSEYHTTLKHFQEVLADWEAFILDEHDPIDDSLHV